ncbi:biopolymer transporter ExbD [bacterium]|nr:biopolymer transporter ExbD [bacterium]
MKRNIYKTTAYTELNVTPLMDLAWNLLVVFIIAVTATVQGIKVNLPKASANPVIAKPRTKAITITSEGLIYLDTYKVSVEELKSRLRQYKAADPDLPVVIKGDESISYQLVIEVLDILSKLDITHLGLVTQKIVK